MLRYMRIDPSNSNSNTPKTIAIPVVTTSNIGSVTSNYGRVGFIGMPFRPTDVPGGSIPSASVSISETGRRVSASKAFSFSISAVKARSGSACFGLVHVLAVLFFSLRRNCTMLSRLKNSGVLFLCLSQVAFSFMVFASFFTNSSSLGIRTVFSLSSSARWRWQ